VTAKALSNYMDMHRWARAAWGAFIAIAAIAVLSQAAQAQTEGYTGGTPSPGPSTVCSSSVPKLSLAPPGTVATGEIMVATTTGHNPGSTVTLTRDGAVIGSGAADANGAFSATFPAPTGPTAFVVCASSPLCTPVCLDPTPVVGTAVLGRSFARTGIETGILLLIALAAIYIGRRLLRASRRPPRRNHPHPVA
jgi:hypothetical protein